ncbi:hypothetical protein ACU686_35340 [Yinghuangia aomiensis]
MHLAARPSRTASASAKAALYYHFRTEDRTPRRAQLRPAPRQRPRGASSTTPNAAEATRPASARPVRGLRRLPAALPRARGAPPCHDVSVEHPPRRPRPASSGSITARVDGALQDPARPVEYRVAATVALGGFYSAIATFPHPPDPELRAVLLDIVRRLAHSPARPQRRARTLRARRPRARRPAVPAAPRHPRGPRRTPPSRPRRIRSTAPRLHRTQIRRSTGHTDRPGNRRLP